MNSTTNKKESDDIKKYLWGSVLIALLIGMLMIALISSYTKAINQSFLNTFGCGVLIAGASASSGGFLGFIFGIPSILQNPSARLKYNDNLVQVSDWLTKIIVGVGLTQLYNIPSFLNRIGEHFQINFGAGDWGRNVAIAIIGYFLVLGFLMVYFWTKTDYSTVMKEMDDDLNKQLQDTQKMLGSETIAKEQAQKEVKDMATEIVQKETQQRIINSTVAGDTNTLEELKQGTSNNLSNQLDQLKLLVSQELSKRPVVVPDDLQKNRWGAKAENNGKKIAARVSKNNWQNLYDVLITISNTDNSPLSQPVAIFVHDTYQLPDNAVYVMPNTKGVAELSLLAYEAFTVGALCADGTDLELNLNEQPGYPAGFYWQKDQ